MVKSACVTAEKVEGWGGGGVGCSYGMVAKTALPMVRALPK